MHSECEIVPLDFLMERIESGWSPECEPQAPGLGEWGVIRVSAVTSGSFNPAQAKRLPAPHVPRPSLEIRVGDLLMARANGALSLVGVTCLVDATPGRLLLCDKVLRLKTRPRIVDDRYLNLALSSTGVRRQIQSFLSGGSGQNNISQEAVRRLQVPIFPLGVQRHIVAAVSSVSRNIGALELRIGKLAAIAADLSAAMLGPLFDDKGSDQRRFLEEIAVVAAGVTLGSEAVGDGSVELPYLRVANVLDGIIDTSHLKTLRIFKSQLNRFALHSGDVLLTEGGDLDKLGRGAVWDGRISPCLHQNHVFRVRCGPELIPDYLSLYLASPEARRHFMRIGKQSTNLASINLTQVKRMRVPAPSVEDQRRAVAPIQALRRQVQILRSQASKLKVIRDALAEDLLSGRVRVTDL